jgi:hypothetical protein
MVQFLSVEKPSTIKGENSSNYETQLEMFPQHVGL